MMLYLVFSFILALANPQETSVDLTVNIHGIKDVKGNINLALYDKEEGFRDEDAVVAWKIEAVTDKEMSLQFVDLKPGEYAIAVFHDRNKNEKIDKNLLGIPKEGYGFSNDAAKKLRAPYFREAKISIKESSEIDIKMIYR